MGKLLELSGLLEGSKMARRKTAKRTTRKAAKKATRRKTTTARRKATRTRKPRGVFGDGMEEGICMSLTGNWVFAGLSKGGNAKAFFQDLMKTARRLKREGKLMGAWLWGQRARTVARRYGLKAEEKTADRFIDTLFK